MGTYVEGLTTTQKAFEDLAQENIGKIKPYNLESKIYSIRGYTGSDIGIVGVSKKMLGIFYLIEMVANTNSPVLIIGDQGTGRELTAMAIHNNGSRYDEFLDNYVVVNCLEKNQKYLDSELSGGDRSMPTRGRIYESSALRRAGNGTLFLKDLCELPMKSQRELLKILDTERAKNVRLIASANEHIQELVLNGKFLRDLFERFSGELIYSPTVKERGVEDIDALTDYFIEHNRSPLIHSEHNNGEHEELIAPTARSYMHSLNFPENVRSLEFLIKMSVHGTEGTITKKIIQKYVTYLNVSDPLNPHPSKNQSENQSNNDFNSEDYSTFFVKQPASLTLEEWLPWLLKEGLTRCKGDIAKLSREIGVERRTLYNWFNKYGIDHHGYRKR